MFFILDQIYLYNLLQKFYTTPSDFHPVQFGNNPPAPPEPHDPLSSHIATSAPAVHCNPLIQYKKDTTSPNCQQTFESLALHTNSPTYRSHLYKLCFISTIRLYKNRRNPVVKSCKPTCCKEPLHAWIF